MTEHKSMLCVGGPRAGQRIAISNGTGFTTPVNQNDDITNFRYKREIFHTPQGDVSFFVVEGTTSLETIEILLTAYEELNKQ